MSVSASLWSSAVLNAFLVEGYNTRRSFHFRLMLKAEMEQKISGVRTRKNAPNLVYLIFETIS